ncbi:MAG TPA: DUF692 family protein [Kofleriaceae bacterium]|nr:DUF692 family protein [Kofleriaceae bacterium]
MGQGIGFQFNFYTAPIFRALVERGVPLDYVELLCDTVSGSLDGPHLIDPRHRGWFDELRAAHPLVAHSNYGEQYGFKPLEDTPFVRRHAPIVREMGSPWVADHMFYGTDSTGYLWSTPIQFSRQEAARVAERAARLQDLLGIPLAHENAFIYALCPGSDIEEADFLASIVEKSGTHLLLDLHNIYANSVNFDGYDCWRYLKTIPLDRVIQLHIAGGQWIDGWYHDLHNHPVPDPVWEMLEFVLARARNVRGVTLELQGPMHTAQSRPIDADWAAMAGADILRARSIWEGTRAGAL